MSKFKYLSAFLIMTTSLVICQPTFAQSFDTMENSSQVDITRGMAEQNAAYVAGSVSMTAPAQNMGVQQGQYAQNQYSNQPAQAQIAQNQFAPNQFAQNQSSANQFPQNQMQANQCAPNLCMQNNNFAPQNQQQVGNGPHLPSGMGMGITKQMVGVLGTAVIWNYMQNGALNGFRPRGFGGPFNSFGPR